MPKTSGSSDTGTTNLLVDILDLHVHSYERWYGASPGQVGPGLANSLLPFRATSAAVANTFGNEIVVFDGTETPAQAGMLSFDFHRIQIINVQNNAKTWRIRVANNRRGAANYAAAVVLGDYSDIVFKVDRTNADSVPVMLQYPRVNSGTKIWVAVATLDAVAQWVEFIVGFHEYDHVA